MSDEPKRNIVIESDDISSFSLGFDGEGWTRIVRSLWAGGQSLRALAALMQGLKGLNFDVAVKILEGKLQIVGQSPNMKVIVDSMAGLPSLDQAMAQHENARMLAAVGEQAVSRRSAIAQHRAQEEEDHRQHEIMKKMMEKNG